MGDSAGGGDFGGVNGELYRYDGNMWAPMNLSSQAGANVDAVGALQVFDDRLYIGVRADAGGTKSARVYYYDGTSFYLDLSGPSEAGYSGIEAFGVHNGVLYAANGSRQGEVYRRDEDGNWSILGGGPIETYSPARALASFNESLYAGTGTHGNQAKVWRWTGSQWELVENLTDLSGYPKDGVWRLVPHDGILYAGLAGPGAGLIYAYDGTGWIVSLEVVCASTRPTIVRDTLWVGPCGDVYVLDGAEWKTGESTGEGYVFDFVEYGGAIYAATAYNGLILYTVPPNNPPTAAAGGPYLVAVGATGLLNGTGSDPDQDPLTFLWTATAGSFDNPTAEDPTYTAGNDAGIFELTLTAADPGGLSDADTTMVVVYDPEGGFVTGGGWIDSPGGAYTADPSLTGKANFGFVSKYKKGAQVPTGNTEFQFHSADLNFHSSSYEWLVVTGSDYARFKGSGTINGIGDYRFMLWAGDGEPDTFRVKIWEEDEFGNETVIYDNGFDQAIGGGSIVIHKAK